MSIKLGLLIENLCQGLMKIGSLTLEENQLLETDLLHRRSIYRQVFNNNW